MGLVQCGLGDAPVAVAVDMVRPDPHRGLVLLVRLAIGAPAPAAAAQGRRYRVHHRATDGDLALRQPAAGRLGAPEHIVDRLLDVFIDHRSTRAKSRVWYLIWAVTYLS